MWSLLSQNMQPGEQEDRLLTLPITGQREVEVSGNLCKKEQ